MTIKTRLAKLETNQNPGLKKYICCYYSQSETRYKIQPYAKDFGGPGGDPFYLDTWEEVQAFGAGAGINLDIIKICFKE